MFDVDPGWIGARSIVAVTEIEKGTIRRFAQALGETNPIYFDEEAARAAGYPSLLAPPTFAITLTRNPIPGLTMPRAGVIHGEQEFLYGRAMTAGDRISVSGWLAEVREVKGRRGPMTLVTLLTEGCHADGTLAFQSRSVLIIPKGVA